MNIMFNINIPSKCTHVKLDIGLSYCAPHSQSWLSKEPNLMVFGFEPNPNAFVVKKFNGINLNNINKYDNRFFINKVALGNVEKLEEMTFYSTTKDCGTSSLYEPIDNMCRDRQGFGPFNKIKVPVLSLKMFFDEFPWDRFEYIDYIKVDAQGSDLSILKGAGAYLREKVVFVTAEPDGEFYIGSSECNLTNITNYMLSQDFVKINHPNTNDPTYVNKKFMDLSKSIYIEQK